MAISDWMDTLKTKVGELTGITAVYIYDDLPGSLVEFPCAVILPTSGDTDYSAGGPNNSFHEVQITLYTAGQILPEAFSQAVPFIDLLKKKLAANMTLDGTVNHILPSQAGAWYDGPGGLIYAGKTHLGIIFRYSVKEQESFTVSA